MRVLTSRPKRLIAATALFSAVTLTGVGAAQATASPTYGGGGSSHAGNKDAVGAAFGSCMREHGLKNFPDLSIQVNKSKGGGTDTRVSASGRNPGSYDPASKAYQRAIKACGPILRKAGVRLPPPVPPGDAHCKVVKVVQGGKGKAGLPELPGAPKDASAGHITKQPREGGSGKGGEKGRPGRQECATQEKPR
jgi:hypothetical protein